MLSSNRRPSGGGNSEVRCHRALIVCGACFSSPYASFKWMWTPITRFYREICSPLTGGPSGVRNSEVRSHRALNLCGACSSRPYASFKWMWTPITRFYREICSPLTGGPSGVRNSEVRCHRFLIFGERVPLVQTHLLRGCGPL